MCNGRFSSHKNYEKKGKNDFPFLFFKPPKIPNGEVINYVLYYSKDPDKPLDSWTKETYPGDVNEAVISDKVGVLVLPAEFLTQLIIIITRTRTLPISSNCRQLIGTGLESYRSVYFPKFINCMHILEANQNLARLRSHYRTEAYRFDHPARGR